MTFVAVLLAAVSLGSVRTPDYQAVQRRLAKGWNTWYNNSMTAQVKLPEGVGFNFGLATGGTDDCQREFLKYSERANQPARIVPGLRTDDGAYTSATLGYRDFEVRLETATDGDDLLALVTALRGDGENYVLVEPIAPFAAEGARPLAPTQVVARVTRAKPFVFFTGRARTDEEVENLVAARRAAVQARVAAWGDKAEAFLAMQTVLAWNTIYDAPNRRVITPVCRPWNRGSGGWVLFDWDTYFAAYMFSSFNRDLAYANAVEISKCVTEEGFVPNFRNARGVSDDRSQPPVGSRIVWEIYCRHRERWFLEEVYGELLAWNRWWPEARDFNGYLCWGTHRWRDGKRVPGTKQDAMFESGLDNSPIFDDVPMSVERPVLLQADVGLLSLYVMDCKALARIATELGREADAREALARADRYAASLSSLWNEARGIYMNRRLDTNAWSEVLTPCNFYPLLAGVPSPRQAERMIREHYFNPDEFHGTYVLPSCARNSRAFSDNSYWRGRIWAPLNLLVYLGLREYGLDAARHDLVRRSNELLLANWRKTGGVYENYNAVSGVGGDVGNSDGFYHWGALLSYLRVLEEDGVSK